MEYPQFKSKAEELKFIVENQNVIITEKTMKVKCADSISYSPIAVVDQSVLEKGVSSKVSTLLEADSLVAKLVINTTKIMDSHGDVHMDGIWKKSLQETKDLYLLQEHQMTFKNIISGEVKASVAPFTWKELGFKFDGSTQALVFDVTIQKDRNPYMFEQYAKGYVKNHSVGMRYVKISLAVNDPEYAQEKIVWDKYISQIANKQQAESVGYFWAVLEAKVIEGSAVPIGSNVVTPTISVETKDDNEADLITSQVEADIVTSQQITSKGSSKLSIYF